MKQETSIATREQAGALATNIFEADADKGIENIAQQDLALPFLKILGQLSPEVNKREAKYVEGAEAGMILNTVTNQLYPALNGAAGINVLPVYYKRQYIEWQDRGKGQGAPVKIYEASDDVPKTTRDGGFKDRLDNGNYLENTASHFVYLVGKHATTALISMKATQLKISRKWNSMMMGIKMQGKNGLFTPPTYSHIYNLKTVRMSNDKGTWFGWDVSKVGPVTDKKIYDAAKKFSLAIAKGNVLAKHVESKSKDETPF